MMFFAQLTRCALFLVSFPGERKRLIHADLPRLRSKVHLLMRFLRRIAHPVAGNLMHIAAYAAAIIEYFHFLSPLLNAAFFAERLHSPEDCHDNPAVKIRRKLRCGDGFTDKINRNNGQHNRHQRKENEYEHHAAQKPEYAAHKSIQMPEYRKFKDIADKMNDKRAYDVRQQKADQKAEDRQRYADDRLAEQLRNIRALRRAGFC